MALAAGHYKEITQTPFQSAQLKEDDLVASNQNSKKNFMQELACDTINQFPFKIKAIHSYIQSILKMLFLIINCINQQMKHDKHY